MRKRSHSVYKLASWLAPPLLFAHLCRRLFWIPILALLCACPGYRPMPLNSETVARQLKPPDMRQLRISAAKINHPILKPIAFDERDGLSADEAAILAVIANPGLRAARDRKQIAAAQLLQAGILPNPQLTASFATPVGGETQGKVNAFGLGLSWNVASLVARGSRMEAARSQAASVDLQVAWQEWQVAEAAKLHCYRLALVAKSLRKARQVQKVSQEAHRLIEQGLRLGEKTAAESAKAAAGLEEAKTLALQAQAKAERERLALNRVLGLPASRVLQLQENIYPPSRQKMPSVRILCHNLEKRRLDLVALRLGYEAQEARLRAAIRSRFPRIGLGFSGARDTDRVRTVGVGVEIELPFFNRHQGRISLEKATRKQLFDEYTARLFQARADIARIVKEVQSIQKQLASMDRLISALRAPLGGYRQAVEAGRIEMLSYYRMLRKLYLMELERTRLEQRQVDLEIALEIASGRYRLFCPSSNPGHLRQSSRLETLK